MFNLFILVFFLLGCNSNKEDSSSLYNTETDQEVSFISCGYSVSKHPCNFKLIDQNNNEVSLYDFYEKTIVLDFSTMWCGVCKNLAPVGEEIYNEYKEEDFIWLTVLIDNKTGEEPNLQDVKSWAESYGITSHVLAGNRGMLDPAAESGYPISGLPTFYIINKEMIIKEEMRGWSEQTIRFFIEENL